MNYDRQSRLWRVRETDYCIFHLEPPVEEDPDIPVILAGADDRYVRIRELFGQPPLSAQEREGLLRLNYWLYAPSAIPDADLPPGATRFAEGAGSASGVVYGQRGFRWSECVPALEHETIHVLWGLEAGQAPSLLNEGVAVYFGARVSHPPGCGQGPSHGPTPWQRTFHAAWQQAITSGRRSLRDFCTNAGFWGEQRPDQGSSPAEPYHVGGALAGYLAEAHGVPLLKDIFRSSHYRDQHLAATLERLTGMTVEDLAREVGGWWERSSADGRAPAPG